MTASLDLFLKWIHLVATVAWIGGMFTNFFIYIPSIAKTLDAALAGKLMASVMKRFRILVYISMVVFLISGLTMAALHLDTGALQSSKNQMVAILIFKLPLYILMLILAFISFESIAPKAARLSAEGPSPRLQKARRTQKILAAAGFVLGMLVLALSAMF